MRSALLLAIAAATALHAADQVVIDLPRAGGTVHIVVDGSEFEVAQGGERSLASLPAVGGRAAVRANRAAVAAANPGAGISVVGRIAGLKDEASSRAVLTDQIAVRPPAGADPDTFLKQHGLLLVQGLDFAPGYVLATTGDGDGIAAAEAAAALRAAGVWAELQVRLPRGIRLVPSDPLAADQWHLAGTDTADINVASVWDTYTGAGTNVAVVDDGIDLVHADLSAGVRTDIDIDLLSNDSSPSHAPTDEGHGTVVAGLIGARQGNGVGGVGVAFGTGLVGVRMLGAGTTDAMEGQALGYRSGASGDHIWVSNNSWGPADDGLTLGSNGTLQEAGIIAATDSGRGGRGTVIVVAGGNGYLNGDSADYDAFASHRRTIGVVAIGPDGIFGIYSEQGAGLLISAPGGRSGGEGIVSTDATGSAGFVSGSYLAASDDLYGTSFAAPIVAGAVALMLQARPELSWRDVPQILARTARYASGSTTNGAGLRFSIDYGFGLLNVQSAVTLAQSWVLLPPEQSVSAAASGSTSITDNNTTGITRSLDLSAAPTDFVAERVAVTVNLTHPSRGEVEYYLTSPQGTTTRFSRRSNDIEANLENWTFTAVDMLGERAQGTWTLKACDLVSGNLGSLGDCSITVYGYRPYGTPVTTSVFPSAVLLRTAGDPDVAVQATGTSLAVSEGGDLAHGKIYVAGTGFTSTPVDSAWAATTVPASYFTTLGPVAVAVSNPQVPGPGLSGPAGGGVSTTTVSIIVRAADANTAPVLDHTTDATVRAGLLTTGGAAVFTDADGDALRYRIGTAPTLGTATINQVSGTVTYFPAVGNEGTDTLTVIATDGMADSAPATITYTVQSSNRGVTIVGGGSGAGDNKGTDRCGAGGTTALGLLALGLLTRLRRRR